MNGDKQLDRNEFLLGQIVSNDIIDQGKRDVPMLADTLADTYGAETGEDAGASRESTGATDPLAGYKKSGWAQVAQQEYANDANMWNAAHAGANMNGPTLAALNRLSQDTNTRNVGHYANQFNTIAGLGQTSAGSASSSLSQYGANASNAAQTIGNIRSQAAQQQGVTNANTLQNILYGLGQSGVWGQA